MIKISLYIITYNEELRLGCTLKAAAPLVDEIIVVDCGSTDKTVEIAKEWEKKARNLQEKSGWICTHCGHTSGKWEPVCPTCHLFNLVIPN